MLLKSIICATMLASGSLWAANLLENGGFERYDGEFPAPWSGTPGAVSKVTNPVAEGKNAVKLQGKNSEDAPILAQNVTKFDINRKYRFSYRATGKDMVDYRAYIGVWNGSEWVTGFDTEWRQSGPMWQRVNTEFELKSPSDRLMIVLQSKGDKEVIFDDVSLEPLDLVVEKKNMEIRPVAPFAGNKLVNINEDMQFEVGGEPFFSLGIWGWNPLNEEELAQAHDWGFNTVRLGTYLETIGAEGYKKALDIADKYGMKAISVARFQFKDTDDENFARKVAIIAPIIAGQKDHPALFGHDLADEPAWGSYSLQYFGLGGHLLRKLDPKHPIFTNHAPRNKIAELAKYNQYVDVSGVDIYPIWNGPDRHSDLPNKTLSVVGDETVKNLKAVDYKKPVIMTVQANSWSDMGVPGNPVPTVEQLRFQAYDCLVNGAAGIHYYAQGTTLKPELKLVARELNSLQDVFAKGKKVDVKLTENPGVMTLVKKYRDSMVVIAVNRTGKVVDATLDTAALGGKFIQLYGSDKNARIGEKSITLEMAPFGSYIFTNGTADKILRPFVPAKVALEKTLSDDEMRKKHEVKIPAKNLALNTNGATAFSSTQHSPALGTANVNDGDRWLRYWNDATALDYPDFIGVMFPEVTKFNTIVLYTHGLAYYGGFYGDGIRDYAVQISDDGENYRTILNLAGNNNIVEVIRFDQPVTAKYLRFFITGTNGGNDYSRVNEIEVYLNEEK